MMRPSVIPVRCDRYTTGGTWAGSKRIINTNYHLIYLSYGKVRNKKRD